MHHQVLTSAISLRSKFGLPDNDDANLGQLILGVVSAGMVGFWVDEVYETVNSSELEWRNMPEFVPHAAFDRFAAKDSEVIMSTTMQQLYDVPAEEMASMLAGVRQSFDLPQDLPPVAAEGFDSGDGDDSEDSFGDLTDAEPRPGADEERDSFESTDSESSIDNKSGISAVPSGESPEGHDNREMEAEGRSPPGSTAANAGNKPSATGPSAVVNLSAHRAAHATNAGKPGRHQATAGGQQFTRSTARAASGRAADQNIHARRPDKTEKTRARSVSDHASNRNHSPFSGGTHAGAFDRLNQNQPAYGSSAYGGNAGKQSSQHYDADNENQGKRSSFLWWLLAVVLLLILIAFWLWPSSKRETTSTIPHQNYQPSYTFREQAASAPTAREPANSYEAVSPPPVPVEQPITDPGPEAESIAPPAEMERNNAVDSANPNEVYRLEGEDVTLTVERQRPVVEQESAREAARTESVSIPVPGYDEYVHIVVKGDTLWDIAAKYLKNPFRYPELARLSEITNPDLIYPGDTVRIRARRNQP